MNNAKMKIQSLKKMKSANNFVFTTYEKLSMEEDGIVLQAELIRKQLKVTIMKSWSHVFVVGSGEVGTTQCFINPTIQVLMNTKTKPSMVITDKGGRLYYDNAIAFAKNGYKVLHIDFDKPLCNLDLCSIYENPTVLFIKISSEIYNEHNTLFNSLITNLYNELKHKIESCDLNRKIYFLLDEFGNLPVIEDIVGKLKFGVRSKKIKFVLVINSCEQLEVRYGEKDADAIKNLCWTRVFFDTSNFSIEMKQLGYRLESGDILIILPNHALCKSKFTPSYQFKLGEQK